MGKLGLIVISLFILVNCVNAQKSRHKFWIYHYKPQKMGIEELLKKNIHTMGYNDSLHCEMRWSIFYFNVDYKGRIKDLTIDQRGRLDTSIVNKVRSNIYGTQGLWHIPKGTHKKEVCKFIYPFFRYDLDTTNCSVPQIQIRREVYKFVRLFFKLKEDLEKDKGHIYVISPRIDVPGQHYNFTKSPF
jgi:hypothetical protein